MLGGYWLGTRASNFFLNFWWGEVPRWKGVWKLCLTSATRRKEEIQSQSAYFETFKNQYLFKLNNDTNHLLIINRMKCGRSYVDGVQSQNNPWIPQLIQSSFLATCHHVEWTTDSERCRSVALKSRVCWQPYFLLLIIPLKYCRWEPRRGVNYCQGSRLCQR